MEEKRRRTLVLLIVPLLVLLMIGSCMLYGAFAVFSLDRKHAAMIAHYPKSAEEREPPIEKVPLATPPPAPTRAAAPEPPKTLSPTVKVQGRVLLIDKRPAPFAKVDFFVADSTNKWVRHQVIADVNGMFELLCPRHARAVHTAHVAGAGRSYIHTPIFEPDDPATICDYALHLRQETIATGVVEGADGIPVNGATLKFHPFRVSTTNSQEFSMGIYVDPEDETWWKEWVLTDSEVMTDPTGAFRAPSLGPIHYVVEVQRGGHDPEFIPVHDLRGSLRLRLSK